MLTHLTAPAGPGEGEGWSRLVEAIRPDVPAAEVDGVWVFPPVRREGREFGTAIISRVSGERRRIYTASYILTQKGKKRGMFEAALEEIGAGPLEALEELLAMVPRRSDEEPPIPIPVERWFTEDVDDADLQE